MDEEKRKCSWRSQCYSFGHVSVSTGEEDSATADNAVLYELK